MGPGADPEEEEEETITRFSQSTSLIACVRNSDHTSNTSRQPSIGWKPACVHPAQKKTSTYQHNSMTVSISVTGCIMQSGIKVSCLVMWLSQHKLSPRAGSV